MWRVIHFLLGVSTILLFGCTARPAGVITQRVTIFVPGAAGDGVAYNGLVEALTTPQDEQDQPSVHVLTWGAPGVFFFNNFSDQKTHDSAEQKLARYLDALPDTVRQVDLVAHSAGCGVVVGGLARTHRRVDTIVLIAPSFSPTYDLAPALERSRGHLHLFHSIKDTTFLKWRTGHFGTYDRIKTPAAGYAGADLSALAPPLAARVVQHPWQTSWEALDNDGGHFGGVSGKFVRHIVLPLFRQRDDPR